MKKLIVISVLLVILIGFSVFESAFSTNVLRDILSCSDQLITILSEEEFNEIKAKEEYKKIEDKWDSYESFALIFLNHSTVKDFTQKLNTLKCYIDENDKKESYVAVFTLKVTAENLLKENLPLIENIL